MGNIVELIIASILAVAFGAAAFATFAMGQGPETQELVTSCLGNIMDIDYLIGSLL